ncbi:MAG: hypothetical protein GF418_11335 [Chitinivibrionales bacterium]|nr:hypothetical protein [Chitinivibrionales bacterium]MBD3396208.1 hypothetical protein [Chitinivibrionales bacterium]
MNWCNAERQEGAPVRLTDLLRSESYKRGIAVSTALTFVAGLFGFLNNVVIAYFFGTNTETDVYFYAYSTIMIAAMFLTGFSSSILIPESMHIRERDGPKAAMQFLNAFLYVFLGIALAISLVFYLNPVGAFTLLSNFDTAALEAHRRLLVIAIPLLTFMTLTLVMTDVLSSYKYFTLPMIVNMIMSGCSMAFVILFHRVLGVLSILTGVLVAYAANVILLLIILRLRLHWVFSFKWVAVGRKVRHDIVFAQLGNLTTALAGYVPIYALSGLGTGIISSLRYGRIVAELPTQFISRQFSVVSGIRFNELHAKQEYDALSDTFVRAARFLAFILLPVSGMLFILAEEVITLVYKRGAFDLDSVRSSALFLRYFALSLSLVGVDTIIARIYMATKKIKQSFLYQMGINIALVLLLFALVRPMGAAAYPLAVLAVYVVNLFAHFFMFRLIVPFMRYGRLLGYFGGIFALNAATAALVFALVRAAGSDHHIVRLLLGGGTYTAIIILANFAFGINDDALDILKRAVRVMIP